MFKDMVNFLDSSWEARGFIVPCLIGPAGIGKTAAVRQHAANVGAKKVVTIIASQILPNEVSGITMPVPETKAMEIFDHYRLSSLEDGDILFFDELLEADQLVLSACLTLIESRQLMSGTILPDVQIIAATNPTIKSNMLKENIRQRFVFQSYDFDTNEVKDFIKKSYGFEPPLNVLHSLKTTGDEYNILSPRSLTKMCEWIATSPTGVVANQINRVWGSTLGSELLAAYNKAKSDPMVRCRQAIWEAVDGIDNPELLDLVNKDFTEEDLVEIMELLQTLPEWEEFRDKMESIELLGESESKIEF